MLLTTPCCLSQTICYTHWHALTLWASIPNTGDTLAVPKTLVSLGMQHKAFVSELPKLLAPPSYLEHPVLNLKQQLVPSFLGKKSFEMPNRANFLPS